MKKSGVINVAVFFIVLSFFISGCTVKFYRGRPSDQEKIGSLSGEVERLQALRDKERKELEDAKALLESSSRSFGYIYGREKHIRINTVCQSPTRTTAGSGIKGIDGLLDFTERMSPLGNATAEECADFSIVLFSDLSRKVTMQNIYHDGGFSSMAMSLKAMTQYNKCLDEGDNL